MKPKIASIALLALAALLGSVPSAQAGGNRSGFSFGAGNREHAPYGYAAPGYYPYGTYRYYSPFGTYRYYSPSGMYRSYYPYGTYQQYIPFGSYSVPSYQPYLGAPPAGYVLTPNPRIYVPRGGAGRPYGQYVPRKYYRRN